MSLSNDIVDAIQKANQKKTSAYDSVGTVTRVEDGVAWVHIAGGVDETPVQKTINAKAGDQVQVRVAGGRAWLVGNASSPPTDDTTAKEALDYGKIANDAAQKAVQDSLVASEAAGRAQRTAEAVEGIAQHAEEVAESVEGIAQQASEDAGIARTAADSAMLSLGNVQDVVGVLDWITNHGTMTSQAGETFDANNVYFVVDQNGDYVVGGTRYSLVTEPKAEDIDTYYCLSVDKSIQNYVATHIVVDSEGLWIIPDSGGNKVLIATGGAGKRYETAGTCIVGRVGNDDVVLAQFTADGSRIGRDNETHVDIDYHSLQLTAKGETTPYFWVSDLRDKDDDYQATITETFIGDGTTKMFSVSLPVSAEVSATDSSHSSNVASRRFQSYTFSTTPDNGATITIVYKTTSDKAKAYTFGRRGVGTIGAMSVAEGEETIAKGSNSHAEGYNTHANGENSHAEGLETYASHVSHAEGFRTHADGVYSHAEGYATYAKETYSHAEGDGAIANGKASHAEGGRTHANNFYSHAEGYSTHANGENSHAEGSYTYADGENSHAQNLGTVAGHEAQTAVGRYNDNNQNNAFEIGNGRYDSTADTAIRSNAFEVDWNGNTTAAGDIEDGSGNVLADKLDSSGIFDLIYPVGSYYWTSDGSFSPANTFGGTWEKIDPGVTLVSAGTGYTVQSGTAKDGGEETVKLNDQQMAHGHDFTNPTVNKHHHNSLATAGFVNGTGLTMTSKRAYTAANTSGVAYVVSGSATAISTSANTADATATTSGGSVADLSGVSSTRTAHNNMPPYKAAYCWHRTA